ncbi:unnamed protein product [Phytophthora lilii]|uniref:Unnamed protein product n=1 Tax=Phytophthora lilii TaxID=2077276 RepID=A0A9W6WYQ7_9STRA|nr:unnamed protein product [Phytophthora lilii]
MTTLKILWREKQDMRRVQVAAVHQALAALDGRAAADWRELSFRDLRDYVLLVFPELQQPPRQLLLYYMDDDHEQVRITNDAELDEAFRLMRELAVAAGKDVDNAVCKIIVVAKPPADAVMAASSSSVVHVLPGDADEMLASQQKRKMSDLFVDLGKVVEKWDASAELQTLKKDLVSLLHEPGCQEALMEIMANAKVGEVVNDDVEI